MFVMLRAPAPAGSQMSDEHATAVVDVHHPVDRHDDTALQRPDAWALRNDVHHPVDRHDQP
jgi:hypothetical protein